MNVKHLLAACLSAWLACWLCAGCTFDDTRKHCSRDSECDGDRCFKGFCVQHTLSSNQIPGQGSGGKGGTSSDSGTAGTGGTGANGGSGDTGGTGGTGGNADSGSSNPDSGGSSECSGDATRSCDASWQDATSLGGCGKGKQHCINGVWGSCTPDRMMITTESCNNLDDDCDGQIDEDSNVPCFPPGATGCEPGAQGAQGSFNCKAPCQAGTQSCVDGKLAACSGAKVAAAKDDCSTEQIDENCDGTPNDGCQCQGSATRDCYTGPDDTRNVGICKVGKQQCVSGQWAACQGAVMMQNEICDGKDNDCNNKVDDVVGVGTRCTVAAKQGVCSEGTFQCIAGSAVLTCVATSPNPAPETCDGKDNDCNGMIDDVPSNQLQTDPMNCGVCKKTCSGADKCCAGGCVNSSTDGNNCGTCGKLCASTETCMSGSCVSNPKPDAGAMCGTGGPCASGQLCCSGACVPNDKDHCGKCETKCGGIVPACCKDVCVDLATSTSQCSECTNVCPSQDGGVTCLCATTGTPAMTECRNGPTACQ